MTTARQALIDGTQRLRDAGIDSARTDAELLLCHVLGVTRGRLLLVDALDFDQRMAYERLLSRRQSRVPLQHLTGVAPFRHLTLAIGPGALVPRPETETVVEAAIRWVRAHRGEAVVRGTPGSAPAATGTPQERLLLLDLCSGAAPIALALATELDRVDVVGVELHDAAQSWGRRNVEANASAVAQRGSTLELVDADAGDLEAMARFAGRAALIVTNPPYIPDGMVPRDPEVAAHDPREALFGGPDGFDVIRRLLDTAAMALIDGGLLVIEHADVQGEGESGVPALVRAHGAFADVTDHEDLTGRPRYTTAQRRER